MNQNQVTKVMSQLQAVVTKLTKLTKQNQVAAHLLIQPQMIQIQKHGMSICNREENQIKNVTKQTIRHRTQIK